MQGFIQDFVLGEVRGKCVEGGSGGRYLYALPILQWLGFNTEFKVDAIMLGGLGGIP